MFRNWRRRARRARALRRLAPRLAQLTSELRDALECPVTLVPAGASGRDSIFRAEHDGAVHAMVRVLNPYLARTPLAPGMPFTVLDGPRRLEREWDCYAHASARRLSPRPLWRTHDAVACEFVPGTRLFDILATDTTTFWQLTSEAAAGLTDLHALGIVHMDASLANTLRRDASDGGGLAFIDFEYGPDVGLSTAQQRAYDHLRLIESGLKFAPDRDIARCDCWLDVMHERVDTSVCSADLAPLRPALGRTLGSPLLVRRLAECFVTLRSQTA